MLKRARLILLFFSCFACGLSLVACHNGAYLAGTEASETEGITVPHMTEQLTDSPSTDSCVPAEEYTVTVASSGDNWWGMGVQYPRLLILSNSQSGENGTILLTFEKLTSGLERERPGYPVYRSTDEGKSWKLVTTVRDNSSLQSEWNPFLFELSRPLGNYPAGTVLLAACSVDGAHSTASAIRLYASTDGGRSFGAPVTVATGGGLENGVWEPFLLQLDDGRLVCFYSDDTGDEYAQRIVYRLSEDGVTFGETVEVVASKFKRERPGMPVVTRLGDGSYFMVYEVVDHRLLEGNPVMYRTSKDGIHWGDPADIGTPIESVDGKALGSAPYAAWTPAGGELGTITVSGTFMRKGKSTTGTDIFISRDMGKTWTTVSHPIPYNSSVDHCGYSNSMMFSSDGAIMYAVNNPQKKDGSKGNIVFARADTTLYLK
ncbi:MAG: exo-alpha-sialidase [Ruminococcaceae bacterium]|nr:exo-alpha-sialidase [Oscillospiraceae bacterium]